MRSEIVEKSAEGKRRGGAGIRRRRNGRRGKGEKRKRGRE
jgi:hypothetical protein